MASIFAHGLVAYAFSKGFSKQIYSKKLWVLGVICAIIPDGDVVTFAFGLPYESFWGHRGFTHSILFAVLLGAIVTLLFYPKQFRSKTGIYLVLFFSICTASHGVLDAMTTGGLGVAFLSPFDTTRYFFSFRPIQVSPIGIAKFFSKWGLRVIVSEFLWVALPSFAFIAWTRYYKNKKNFIQKT